MAKRVKSSIRYDDFIARLIPDPAKVEPTMLLSGFVGHGEVEGTVRIFPDPTLGTWYDVSEADIVHSMPIPDSPLGGSHIWVKRDAAIKPGMAAAAPQAAGSSGDKPAPEPTPPSIVCATQIFCPTQMLCPTDIFCGVNQQALAEAAARAGQPRHTGLPCTQGAATFCACTPGHNLMMGAVQAAFQPTPSAVTLCCLQAQTFGDPTPQSRCFVCDPSKR
jgi:hypothetical protein